MHLRDVWGRVRNRVPVALYPALAVAYRWQRRRDITRLQREDAAYLASHPNAVVPDAELRARVSGPCPIDYFLTSGLENLREVEAALAAVGRRIEPGTSFFDFGCGSGRLLIAAADLWNGVRLYGSDVDADAVRWCVDHLPGAVVRANDPLPPLPFPDAAFDTIWCGSVFTHLNETRQDTWLRELTRVLKPDGVLMATVHGPTAWEGLPNATKRHIRSHGFVYARTGADAGIHPDWYQTAWHTREYIERHWSDFVAVKAYIPRGYNDHHDVVVAVHRPGAS